MAEDGGSRPRVVIVGAGIAGLAAAQYLLSHKAHCEVLIIEAKERTGGRIWTGEGGLDIGAQFIHGRKNNPIYDIAASRGLIAEDETEENQQTSGASKEDAEGNDDDEDDKHLFFTQEGMLIPPHVVQEVCEVLDQILDEGNKFARHNISGCDDESIGTFVHREFYKYLRTNGDLRDVFLMKEGIFNWRLLQEKTDNACKSVFELSLYAWGEYMECAGARYMEFKKGFESIVDTIMEDIPANMLRLNMPVKRIEWDQLTTTTNNRELTTELCLPHEDSTDIGDFTALPNKPKVKITTFNGDVITADHVIVTCPLGVLKRSAHELFRPLLPSSKLAVIGRMGFGTVDKLFLEFETPFWDKDCDGLQFAWASDEPLVLSCVENKYHSEYLRKEWYRAIQGFDTLYGHPNVLEGWVAGEEATVMESIPDYVVLGICHELLSRFTNNPDLPKPTRLIRSRWNSDPYILGSYSYIKVGHTASDCDLLATPLIVKQEPRVMFAGEHTHKQYFSTTHGALLSGQREAQRLIDCFKERDNQSLRN